MGLLVLLLGGGMAAVSAFVPAQIFSSNESYAAIHTILEIFAIVVACLIFAVGWAPNGRYHSAAVVWLACGFLAVGLIDVLHTLSYAGMPTLVTPAGPEKAINFWLAARLVGAVALLQLTLRPLSRPATATLRAVALAVSLALVALIGWVGLWHADWLPRTFIPGQGLTPLKVAAEYVIIGLYLAAMVPLLRREAQHLPLAAPFLLAALVTVIASELCFTLYTSVTDSYNLLGHIYKVLASGFLYYALFVGTIRMPYLQLQQAEERLQQEQAALHASEMRFRLLAEHAQDLIYRYRLSPEPGFEYVSPSATAITGYTPEEHYADPQLGVMLVHPDDRPLLQRLSEHPETASKPLTLRWRRKNGTLIWTEQINRLVCDADGRPIAIEGIARDITARKQVEEALQNALTAEQAARDRLQALSARLIAVQEEERRHLARELHDEIGQSLTGLSLVLTMGPSLPPDLLHTQLAEARRQVTTLITQVRHRSLDLRPSMLDDLGLRPALEWYLARYTEQTGVALDVRLQGIARRFDPLIELTAYRIVQEALTNVARHAGARYAAVHVWVVNDQLVIQVADEGRGFNVEAAFAAHTSSGLTGMRERAILLGGDLTIESEPGQGARLLADLPLTAMPSAMEVRL